MTLREKLRTDQMANYRFKRTVPEAALKADVLSNVNGLISTEEKSGKKPVEFTDEKVLGFLAKQVKIRRDTAKVYAEQGATERAERETAEADFLATYLPAQLDEAEVEKIVDEAIAGLPEGIDLAPSMSIVMKIVTLQTKNRADGGAVSALVRSKLGL